MAQEELQQEEIKCNNCEWQGFEEDLILEEDKEICPNCGQSGTLMDIVYQEETEREEPSADYKHTISIPAYYHIDEQGEKVLDEETMQYLFEEELKHLKNKL